MPKAPSVLVACEDLVLLDEVIRYLEEIPHWKLLRSARSVPDLVNLPVSPDCVLLSDSLAAQLAGHPHTDKLARGFVVFGRQETMPALRSALDVNARGFIQWPEQRGGLRSLVEREAGNPSPGTAQTGAMHVVWAPKGGAGASVVAAHLAGALATLNRRTILVDLDLENADQTSILGADAGAKTAGDLLRVAEELSSETVRSVLWSHPLGFDAVLAPNSTGAVEAKESAIRRVLQTVRTVAEHVVVDLPSGLSPMTLAGLRDATSTLLVLTPDLLSLKRARDSIKRLRAEGIVGDDVRVVLNQAGGADITQKEVEAVLGVRQVTRVRADYKIYRVVNRGELSPLACKLLTPLARHLSAGAPQSPSVVPPAAEPADANPQAAPAGTPSRVSVRRPDGVPDRWPVKSRT